MGEKNDYKITEIIYKKYLKKDIKYYKELHPNLKYKSIESLYNVKYGFNNRLEIFKSILYNSIILAIPNDYMNNIELYNLTNNICIKTLEGHKDTIITIRYYQNNSKEYLISASFNKDIIIFYFHKKEFITNSVKINFNKYPSDCILIFDNKNYNKYLVVSSKFCNDFTQIFTYNNYNIMHSKNLKDTRENETCCLIQWNFNEEIYIIECCYKKIVIINLATNIIYTEFNDNLDKDKWYSSGFIYNKNSKDLLCSICSNGDITIWDLINKKLFINIHSKGYMLKNIIKWSNKYAIIVDGLHKCFYIFDLDEFKIINTIYSNFDEYFISLKKIQHPLHGVSLITSLEDNDLLLYTL